MKARDFIEPGEKVIVIFTRGIHFDLGNDNTASTGKWIIDANRSVDRVIIYLRNDETKINTLYIANHAGIEPADIEDRHNIKLTHIQYIGITSTNWYEFAEVKPGARNPIRYLP
jgi:hypothetical protein